jgi:hypothetical protein
MARVEQAEQVADGGLPGESGQPARQRRLGAEPGARCGNACPAMVRNAGGGHCPHGPGPALDGAVEHRPEHRYRPNRDQPFSWRINVYAGLRLPLVMTDGSVLDVAVLPVLSDGTGALMGWAIR